MACVVFAVKSKILADSSETFEQLARRGKHPQGLKTHTRRYYSKVSHTWQFANSRSIMNIVQVTIGNFIT
jgi:hypothetical protein